MKWYECPDCGEEFSVHITYGDVNFCPNCASEEIKPQDEDDIDSDLEE